MTSSRFLKLSAGAVSLAVLAVLAVLAAGYFAGDSPEAGSGAAAVAQPASTPVSVPQEKPGSPGFVVVTYGNKVPFEDTTNTVAWEPADGADWYHVYMSEEYYRHMSKHHNVKNDVSCDVSWDGVPDRDNLDKFADLDEEATKNCWFLERNVTEGNQAMHTWSFDWSYFYWVSACNRFGCSTPVTAMRR